MMVIISLDLRDGDGWRRIIADSDPLALWGHERVVLPLGNKQQQRQPLNACFTTGGAN